MQVSEEKVYLIDSRPVMYTHSEDPNRIPPFPPHASHLAVTWISLGASNTANGLQTFNGQAYDLHSGEGLEVANKVKQIFSSHSGAFCLRFSWGYS